MPNWSKPNIAYPFSDMVGKHLTSPITSPTNSKGIAEFSSLGISTRLGLYCIYFAQIHKMSFPIFNENPLLFLLKSMTLVIN